MSNEINKIQSFNWHGTLTILLSQGKLIITSNKATQIPARSPSKALSISNEVRLI